MKITTIKIVRHKGIGKARKRQYDPTPRPYQNPKPACTGGSTNPCFHNRGSI